MSFDEDDIRRALDSRSAAPSPEFRGRLSGTLAEGRRPRDAMPALAGVMAIVLAIATVGVLVFIRAGGGPRSTPGTVLSPAPSASPAAPSPSPSVASVPGVLKAPPAPIALPAGAKLTAPSHDVVWTLVVDQYLYRSMDEGGTWQQRPLPPFAGQDVEISFVSDREGWLSTVGSPETQCNAQSLALWHTTDAGATWQLLPARGIGDTQCKTGLSFADSQHGFIDAYDPNHRPVIYSTNDGGLSWRASSALADPPGFTSGPAGFELTPLAVKGFGTVLLVPVFGWSGANHLYVYVSTDGGANWTYHASAGLGGDSLAFVTATRWLQLIVPGQSMETTDGGRTWHTSSSGYDQAAPIAPSVVFADGQVGYATVRGGIQVTTDGGAHWTSIRTPGT